MNIKLTSSGLVWTPSIFRWAQNGYKFPKDRRTMVKVISDGYGLTKECAKDILSGKTPVTIDDANGTIEFTHINAKQTN
jgi:hypothetical protein